MDITKCVWALALREAQWYCALKSAIWSNYAMKWCLFFMQDCHISPTTANVHLLVCALAHALASPNQLNKLPHVPCMRVPPTDHYQKEDGSFESPPSVWAWHCCWMGLVVVGVPGVAMQGSIMGRRKVWSRWIRDTGHWPRVRRLSDIPAGCIVLSQRNLWPS